MVKTRGLNSKQEFESPVGLIVIIMGVITGNRGRHYPVLSGRRITVSTADFDSANGGSIPSVPVMGL